MRIHQRIEVGYMKKSYSCVPGSSFVIGYFLASIVFLLWMAVSVAKSGQTSVIPVIVLFIVAIAIFVAWAWLRAMCRVHIREKVLICKTPFCKDIVIEYEKCNIGMDYHVQHGRKVWWIYLSYGKPPEYKTRNPANRMNSLKCQPGFVRIMFRNEIYNDLMRVLPKKQRIGLESARRFFK